MGSAAEVFDATSGYTYYKNLNDGSTTWDKPPGFDEAKAAAAAAATAQASKPEAEAAAEPGSSATPSSLPQRITGPPVSHTEVEQLLQELQGFAGSCGMELAGCGTDLHSLHLLSDIWSAQVVPLQETVAAFSAELEDVVRRADSEVEEEEVAEIIKSASMAYFSAADY